MVIDVGNGILLKPEAPFQQTALDEVAACMRYHDKPKSLEDMAEAIRKGAKEFVRNRN